MFCLGSSGEVPVLCLVLQTRRNLLTFHWRTDLKVSIWKISKETLQMYNNVTVYQWCPLAFLCCCGTQFFCENQNILSEVFCAIFPVIPFFFPRDLLLSSLIAPHVFSLPQTWFFGSFVNYSMTGLKHIHWGIGAGGICHTFWFTCSLEKTDFHLQRRRVL